MPDWDAAQYLKFEKERTQPSIDLIHRIPLAAPQHILDVGCGPGNSTRMLANYYPHAQVQGIDNSDSMIAAATQAHPDLSFQVCDAQTVLSCFLKASFDVVFSNACLQWVPDHAALLPSLMALLRPGGALAVQIPINYKEPIHQIIHKVVSSSPWAAKIDQPRIFYTLEPENYYDLLSELSSDFSMWQTTYYHHLGSHQDIMEWYRGTGLRPYLQALPTAEQTLFESEVFHSVEKAYPIQKDGTIIFPFPRLFFIAKK